MWFPFRKAKHILGANWLFGFGKVSMIRIFENQTISRYVVNQTGF